MLLLGLFVTESLLFLPYKVACSIGCFWLQKLVIFCFVLIKGKVHLSLNTCGLKLYKEAEVIYLVVT